jgi:NTP pyrophosphatase (non-canonical NTP hydrolase)
MQEFVDSFREVSRGVHWNAIKHGWWEGERSTGELIALCHSELSEALEAFRNGNPADSYINKFSAVEAELADTVIRIMDMAVALNLDVAGAIIAKHEYNIGRPYKHGGKKF